MKKEVNIHWFRRDLRLEDNKALHFALRSAHPVLCVFIFDKNILSKLVDKDDARVSFIYETLEQIKAELQTHGSDLHIIHDTPCQAWESVIKKFNVQEVFANEDYEPYAIQRDLKIQKLLTTHEIALKTFKDHTIFAKDDVLKKDGKPYTVYTPYKNKWYELLTPSDLENFNCKSYLKKNLAQIEKPQQIPTLASLGFTKNHLMNTKFKLNKNIIENYHEQRDYPDRNGTSLIGVHLRFGTVSIRKMALYAHEHNKTWMDELVWRDFFSQILFHFPHVIKSSFKEKYDKIQWLNNKAEFKKWCDGKTGYPLVDAGMRELNETGHMHNRVRMVTASFLIKHLLIDWRWGEKYFAQKLMDFDLASNNGNWQWAAGSGCDAAPYFRVFNPHTQLKKFDPQLKYVLKWVPEVNTDQYCSPIVEHSFAYHRALKTYKEALDKAK